MFRRILAMCIVLVILISSFAFADVGAVDSSSVVLSQRFFPVADGCWDTYSKNLWSATSSMLRTTQINNDTPARTAYIKFPLEEIRENINSGAILSKATVTLTLKEMNTNYNYYSTNPDAEGPRVSLYAYSNDSWTEDGSVTPEPLTKNEALANVVSKNTTDSELNYVQLPNQAKDVTFSLDVKEYLLSEISDASDEYVSFEISYRDFWVKDGTYVLYSKEYSGSDAFKPQLNLSYKDSADTGLVPDSLFEKKQSFESDADVFYESGKFQSGSGGNIRTTMVKNRSTINRTAFVKFPISEIRANVQSGAAIKSARVKLFVAAQSYTGTAKMALYKCDNDNWSDEDTSSLVINESDDMTAISRDTRNPENTYVSLKSGLTVGTPVFFDITDALIAEVKKAGDNHISMEVGYFSEWLKSGTTAFYTRNYSGGNHPLLEVEYSDISISDACIFNNNTPKAVPAVGENTVEYTVSNSYLAPKDVDVIWAVYETKEDSKKLVALTSDTITVDGSSSETVTKTITLSDEGEYTSKLMILRSKESLLALTEPERLEKQSLWMPSIFADNAVIQRDAKLPVWGKASVGETVVVTLDSKEYVTPADRYGEWTVTCDEVSLSDKPYTLSVRCANETLEFNNLLAGDVWLCSGQSNMDFALKRISTGKEDVSLAQNYPNIRLFSHDNYGVDEECDDVKNGVWDICSSKTAENFSAVGFLFGKELYDELNVPIGLINSAYGGAPMEAFISREAFDKTDLWFRSELKASDTNRNATYLYNTMIAPIIPYAIKGAIWYQGEANRLRHAEYLELQKIMLDDWRERWGYDFPFIYTQLAPFPENDERIREAQRLFLHESENTAMAVIMDCGEKDDIHPVNKRPVGHRLALCAKYLAYGISDIEYKFPEPVSYTVGTDGSITISYDGVYDGLKTSDGSAVNGFEVCGADGKYTAATSVVINSDNTITVKCDSVAVPSGIRYGFYAYPEPQLNLYNFAGLIATSFIHTFE